MKIFKRAIFIISLPLIVSTHSFAQTIPPDSAALALKHLTDLRQDLLKSSSQSGNDVTLLKKMLALGMWKEVESHIAENKKPDDSFKLLTAEDFILHNEFIKAEQIVNAIIKKQPSNVNAQLLKATLEIQAWRLSSAEAICNKVLKDNPVYEEALLILGRSLLLQKRYPEALKVAKRLQQNNAESAGAYLLEADVYFWDQHPDQAEAPLKKSLSIDPYNADARFSYGYAIWRRIDATQMNAMAAQWEIALALNPLHFQTNWHWGNGHTNLTYADYAEKDDEEVRKVLEKADDLVRKNQINDAIAVTRDVEKQYPKSVLPKMHRAAIYYIAFDMDRKMRLDSAEAIFSKILSVKKHYGPAHNGLSAVIKSKRIPYLAAYDSISNRLATTKITDMENFTKVFPDVSYYPGDMVKAMVWNQLFTSVVYFPFLSKQDNAFRIPPLHQDLAITMKSPSFRYMTTFDNRQWMDIRGVGSGAAAIEYVEKGAFQERNVILHEYVHLFHGRVLTDAECRKIRALYYNAMKEKRTLDYYSQNNEHEYLAQTYPAYYEPVKVHPQDFKSMNTTNDLKTRDPEMYAFLDLLTKKESAYLAGDKQAMASNWSQVYLNMSDKLVSSDLTKAALYLDTALVYDNKYLPAYLAYSQVKIKQKDLKGAEEWLKKAEAVDVKYAPIYAYYADLAEAKNKANGVDVKAAVLEQAGFLKKSIELEDDFQELASLNIQLRELYKNYGMIGDAIVTANTYGKNGAGVSTYLRDRKDDANAFAASLNSGLGDKTSAKVLGALVLQKPQNFEYRNLYADALANNGEYQSAINTVKEAQRILAASGNGRSDYSLRIAEFYQALGNKDSTEFYLKPFIAENKPVREDYQLRYTRLLIKAGKADEAAKVYKTIKEEGDQYYLADYYYTGAKLLAAQHQEKKSVPLYEKAIKENPYHVEAAKDLFTYFKNAGQPAKAEQLNVNFGKLEGPVEVKFKLK